jgi:putative tryptophan/tyrosine transport system substrate-binding protein
MRRRDFVTGIAGSAAVWPLAATAQPTERMRRIGVLVGFDDPDIKVFQQELERLGWSEGRNIHIDDRYAPAGAQVQALAKELVALRPEVIFAQSTPVTAALQKATQTVPIVFTFVIDPIGAGFVASVSRPGGNITGFMVF